VGEDSRTILAVHSGALGDVVLLGHLLRAIIGRATVVAGGEKARLLVGLGAAHRAIDFDSLPMHEVFSDRSAGECRLPELIGPCDLLVSMFAAGDTRAEARLATLARAKETMYLPVRPPAADADCPESPHILDVWGARMGLAISDKPAAWPVPPAWRDEAASLLRFHCVDADMPYFVMHPGAGSAAKRWPLERFAELARRLGRMAQVVFVLGPVELEQWGRDVGELEREFLVLASPPLPALAGLLAGAARCVGNDSGVSHLSAAVGTPTTAIFRGPAQRAFAPRGRRVRVVSADSLEDVTVEAVENASP
jgi:hypothetical protein